MSAADKLRQLTARENRGSGAVYPRTRMLKLLTNNSTRRAETSELQHSQAPKANDTAGNFYYRAEGTFIN